MPGTTYQELLDGVANYYGSGSDQWVEIARYGVTQQTIPIIEQVPGVTVTISNSGNYLGYDYSNPFAGTTNPASIIDSNVQSGSYGQGSFNAQLPATAITNPSTGVTTMESGARTVSTSATVASIADKVSLAVAGVALGTKLGKFIDSSLYNAEPEWWDTHYPTINPETWDNIATTQGGKNAIRAIFGLQNDDTTMYVDERLLAQTYMLLLQQGAYSSAGLESSYGPEIQSVLHDTYIPNPMPSSSIYRMQAKSSINSTGGYTFIVGDNSASIHTVALARMGTSYGNYGSTYVYFAFSEQPFKGGSIWSNLQTADPQLRDSATMGTTSISGTEYYYWFKRVSSEGNYPDYLPQLFYQSDVWTPFNDIPTIFYDGATTTINSLNGVQDNSRAQTYIDPSLITGTTPEQVLQQLKQNYPDLFTDSIYQDVPQPDGTIQRITYIPVPYPNTTNIAQPITDDTPNINPQTDPQVNPGTRTQELLQQLVDSLTTDSTPPDTGEGNTPSAVIPAGSTSALYSIYNPTQVELNSFGAWLWSSNFVDQLLKLFNDPMQAIIGLHKVFAQPAISGTSTIKVGYLDSGVSSNVVGNQYTTIDCGSVNVLEYFGNVFDYDPFTQIYIYLPFVGIEKLDTGDVMRGNVGVKYHVDVLTGACLAEITITRDGAGGILYTFAGNCAVQYPISSGSYVGIVASLTSIAGGVVGTIASGGALAPVAMGAISGIMNAHTRVNHSGAFSGNAGAMGVKKPYLIITRPQTCLADNFPLFDGYPANKTTMLSACSGFVKCETCHVENIPATDAELSEIEMLLKGGIII